MSGIAAQDLASALEALQRDPGDSCAHLAAARAYLLEGNRISSAGHLAQALRGGIETPEDWFMLGRAHLESGELRPATAALDRAALGLPGDPSIRALTAAAWKEHLCRGGEAPAPRPLVIPPRRAEVALFSLSCAPWDLTGSCLSHFIVHWLADALGPHRSSSLIIPDGRARPARAHPEPPDDALRAMAAARTGAAVGLWGEVALAAETAPRIRLCISPLTPGKPAALDQSRSPGPDRLAAEVAELLGLCLDSLLPRRAARGARVDLAALAGLPDEAFLEMVVLAEAGVRGRIGLAHRVARSASATAVGRAICERAARSLSGSDLGAATSVAETLLRARPDELSSMLLLGELHAKAKRPAAAPLLQRVIADGEPQLELEALAILGRIELDSGRTEEAMRQAGKALRLDKSHGPANVVAAAVCKESGDLERMVRHLVVAMPRLSTSDREAEIDAASQPLLAAGRPEALLELAGAATQDGRNTPTLAAAYAVGALQSESGSLLRAAALLEAHLESDLGEEVEEAVRSLFVEAGFRVAVSAYQTGDQLGALRRLTRVLAMDPDHGLARLATGEVLISMGRAEEAYEVLKEAPACPGGGLRAWALLAVALLAMGRTSDAEIAARRAEYAADDYPQLAVLRGGSP